MVALSGLVCVLAVLGLILAFTQFQRVRPFSLSQAIPYRSWMRWHYITGALFGVFALTWAFSGLLSMEPFAWTNARGLEIGGEVFTGDTTDLTSYGPLDAAAFQQAVGERTIKEIEFIRIHDEPYYAVSATERLALGQPRPERLHQPYAVAGRGEPDRVLIATQSMTVRDQPFSTESIVERLKGLDGVRIVELKLLDDYDAYYYSRAGQSPLPVLRLKFDDPAETWIYIDPRSSALLAQVHRFSRIERWLYNGLHSLDFKFWYSKRPLWDIGMMVLLLGGLTMSGFGVYLGTLRLIRDLKAAPKTMRATVTS